MEDRGNEPTEAIREEVAPRPTRSARALIFQGYVILTIAVFTLLAFLARGTAYFGIDLTITEWIQSYHSDWLTVLMRLVSWPGYLPQVVAVIALLPAGLYALGLRREALYTLGAGLGSEGLNFLLKVSIQRPRPSASLVEVLRDVSGFSFPSGHVMFYTAFFGFLLFLSYTHLRASWKRALLLALWAMMVILVGPSRIYLGNHWASDVLAAYLIGSLVLAVVILLYRRDADTAQVKA